MQNEITNQWVYEQAPQMVWEYLTQPELIALWLMPNDFEPVKGHKFQFRVKPIPSLGLDGIMYCEVIEIVPFQKLSYTWKAGPGSGVFTLDTVVEWTLEKYGDGTKLFLRQYGFNETNFSIFIAMSGGWQTNIQKMITHLNTVQHGHTNA